MLQRTIITIIALCCLGAGATAGERANSLTDGAWALQFEINDNFDLRSFEGSTISIKKHTADNAAWRLGLDLSFKTENEDRNFWDDGEPRGNQYEYDTDLVSFQTTLHKLRYVNPDAAVNFFWGLGPTIGYSHSKNTQHIVSATSDISSDRSNTINSFNAGVSAVIGVEWFATESISILAEYGSRLIYSSDNSTSENVDYRNGEIYNESKNENKVSRFSFSANAVKFGLSAYF